MQTAESDSPGADVVPFKRPVDPKQRYRAKKARAATRARELLAWIILFDVIVTIIEVVGALLSGGSLALWANALTGFYDAILLSLNWWGLGHEANGRPKRAKKAARWSDLGLIIGYLGIVIWAGMHLLGDRPHHVEGALVLIVAALAAGVNYLSARRISQKSGNSRSARLKLYAGAAIALATILDGLVLMYTSFWRIDPIVTMVIGIAVIALVAKRLAQPVRND